MLDFPELFAPASRVKGRISIAHPFASDLKPLTEIFVMPGSEPLCFFLVCDRLFMTNFTPDSVRASLLGIGQPELCYL